MTDDPESAPPAPPPQEPQYVRELDPIKVQAFDEQIREEQNLLLGALSGAAAALVGAVAWAAITYLTSYQIGWMAIGVAFLVGWAMRTFGKGVDKLFGVTGAALALLGCLAGNLFMLAALIAREETASIVEVLMIMVLSPVAVIELLAATFSPIDLLFYALALYYGYRYSFRQITQAERESLLRTRLINP